MRSEEQIKKARKKYESKRFLKNVSFNPEKDADIIRFLNSENKNFSIYCKDLIRADIRRKKNRHIW